MEFVYNIHVGYGLEVGGGGTWESSGPPTTDNVDATVVLGCYVDQCDIHSFEN